MERALDTITGAVLFAAAALTGLILIGAAAMRRNNRDDVREPRLPTQAEQDEYLDWLFCDTWDLGDRIKLRKAIRYHDEAPR